MVLQFMANIFTVSMMRKTINLNTHNNIKWVKEKRLLFGLRPRGIPIRIGHRALAVCLSDFEIIRPAVPKIKIYQKNILRK